MLPDEDDEELVPTLFTAATVNVYSVFLERPVNVYEVEVDPVDCVVVVESLVVVAVTEYSVMLAPPSDAGAVQLTEAVPLVVPALAVTEVGASGAVVVVTLFEADEYVPVPAAFTAATWKVYVVPAESPVNSSDDTDESLVVWVVVVGEEVTE